VNFIISAFNSGSCKELNSIHKSFMLIPLIVANASVIRKNEERRLDAFEMKGLKKILRVLWTAKKINEWVLNKAGVRTELLKTVKAKKLAYYSHTIRKQKSSLEKEIMQETMPDACSFKCSIVLCELCFVLHFHSFIVLLAVLFFDLVHSILLFALRLSRPSCNQVVSDCF